MYGRKLAGFLWQNYAEDIILNKLECEKLLSWECFYFHGEKQLFLSVYVEDLKMAGKQENIKPMWDEMKKFLLLEDPKKMADNQYLGCAQKPCVPAEQDVERMGAAFEKLQ